MCLNKTYFEARDPNDKPPSSDQLCGLTGLTLMEIDLLNNVRGEENLENQLNEKRKQMLVKPLKTIVIIISSIVLLGLIFAVIMLLSQNKC